MKIINRRAVLSRMLIVASGGSSVVRATSAQVRQTGETPLRKLAATLHIFIPANPGGGWDQTGRALGAALIATGAVDRVEYENFGGKGGTIGLAKYVEKNNDDPNAILIGGTVMVGAVALQKPAIDLRHIYPVARLTNDYLIAVVDANSKIKTMKDLADAMRMNLQSVPVAGGSAGGVDHMFAGMLARAFKAHPEDLVYKPFSGGAEVINAIISGNAVMGLSGYSEFSNEILSGRIRAIGISSRADFLGMPSFRQQGVDAVMSNWRGVFTGKAVSDARRDEIVSSIEAATKNDIWQRTLQQKRWEGAWLSGKNLNEFIELDLITARVMAYLLKLKT